MHYSSIKGFAVYCTGYTILSMEGYKLSLIHLKNPIHFLALGFGAGLVPKLPGTAGTAVGVLIYLPLQSLHWLYYLLLVLILFVVGIWLCAKSAAELAVHDHPGIVWDEIVGYLIAMTAAPQGWGWIMLGFCLFRLFDINKPWPIRWLDQHVKGGFGIMIDDVLAGIFSVAILQLIAYLL